MPTHEDWRSFQDAQVLTAFWFDWVRPCHTFSCALAGQTAIQVVNAPREDLRRCSPFRVPMFVLHGSAVYSSFASEGSWAAAQWLSVSVALLAITSAGAYHM